MITNRNKKLNNIRTLSLNPNIPARKRQKAIDIEIRRDLIDSLDCIGLGQSEILKLILDKGWLENYKQPYDIIKVDLMHVREKRKELLKKGLEDDIRTEFIKTNQEILKKSIIDKDYRTALEASKNILQVRGIDIENVVKIKGDQSFAEIIKSLIVNEK